MHENEFKNLFTIIYTQVYWIDVAVVLIKKYNKTYIVYDVYLLYTNINYKKTQYTKKYSTNSVSNKPNSFYNKSNKSTSVFKENYVYTFREDTSETETGVQHIIKFIKLIEPCFQQQQLYSQFYHFSFPL